MVHLSEIILLCEAPGQCFLTLQVIRYCHLALQSRITGQITSINFIDYVIDLCIDNGNLPV